MTGARQYAQHPSARAASAPLLQRAYRACSYRPSRAGEPPRAPYAVTVASPRSASRFSQKTTATTTITSGSTKPNSSMA